MYDLWIVALHGLRLHTFYLFIFQIILNSMHRFQPRIYLVVRPDGSNAPITDIEREKYRTYIFPETIFTAVTAYQNQLVSFVSYRTSSLVWCYKYIFPPAKCWQKPHFWFDSFFCKFRNLVKHAIITKCSIKQFSICKSWITFLIWSATSQLGLTGRLDRNVLDHLLSVNGHTIKPQHLQKTTS